MAIRSEDAVGIRRNDPPLPAFRILVVIAGSGLALLFGLFLGFYWSVFLVSGACYVVSRMAGVLRKDSAADSVFRTIVAISGILLLSMALNARYFLPTGSPKSDEKNRPRCDFMHFYASGLIIREKPTALYRIDEQGRQQRRATGLRISHRDIDFLPYSYAPFLALAIAPLTFLSFRAAYFLMTAINFSLLAVSLIILIRRFELSPEQSRLLGLAVVTGMPVYATLINGQMSFLALLLMTLVVSCLSGVKSWRAGASAGLLLFKPSLAPIALLGTFGRRQAFLGAIVTGSVAFGACVLLVGIAGIGDWLLLMKQMAEGRFFTTRSLGMHNLRALFAFFDIPAPALWIVSAVVVGSALILLRRASNQNRWPFASLVLAILISAPHLYTHDLALGIIPFAIAASTVQVPIRRATVYVFFLISLTPPLVLATVGGVGNRNWPIVPVVLLGLFAFTSYKSLTSTPVAPSEAD